MKRWIALAVALLLVGAGTWVVASRVESPNQVAARAKPPAPDPVVAELARGYLNGPLSMSATAQYQQTTSITPPPALTGVVTSVEAQVGAQLGSGSVLLRCNGRPVFVLTGAFALYRDIQPGDTGDDVAAVQAGLVAAGYSTGRDRTGVYGRGTQSAVRAMYKAAGYKAPETAPAAPAGTAAAAPGGGGSPADTTASPPSAAEGTGTGSSTDTTGEGMTSGTPTAPASTSSAPPAATTPVGPIVLRTEVVMVTGLPATVAAVAPVGTQLSDATPLVVLNAGQVVLSTTLPAGSLGALVVGATGTFTDDAGAAGAAQVTAVVPAATPDQVTVVLASTGTISAGSSYVLAIDNPAAESGESLLAPISAVVARGGRSFVYVKDGDVFREVEVTVAGSVGGVAAITAAGTGGQLDAGTVVRIG